MKESLKEVVEVLKIAKVRDSANVACKILSRNRHNSRMIWSTSQPHNSNFCHSSSNSSRTRPETAGSLLLSRVHPRDQYPVDYKQLHAGVI